MTRPAEELIRVQHLNARGMNRRQIARVTGIPRSTISGWLNGQTPSPPRRCFACGGSKGPFSQFVDHAYAYLLGLYLGDGCLLKTHRQGVMRLNLAFDERYPVIVDKAIAAVTLVMPSSKASLTAHPVHHYVWLNSHSKHWLCLFPQHGVGRKHQRKIALQRWQREICDRYPWRLLLEALSTPTGADP